jgi:hypothetical protein
MTVPVDFGADLLTQCNQILAATNALTERDKRIAQIPDVYRIWDGDWNLHHLVNVDLESEFSLQELDTGDGKQIVPTNTHVGKWLIEMQERIDRGETLNVFLTIDTASGERMGYMLDRAIQRDDADGTSVVESLWKSDFEKFKFYQIRSNPFLPAWVQFPRAFLLPGPTIWVSKTVLFLQLWRENNPLLTFLDDPFLNGTVFNDDLDQSEWPIVIKPTSFMEDMNAGTQWCICSSRWDNYYDRMVQIWRDAEITPVLRRYLAGDPEPWPGANLRNGTLVIDFVDNSGTFTGTSHGGNIFSGLLSTITSLAGDFIDSTIELYEGNIIPAEYYEPGSGSSRGNKVLPTCVYLANENSGITDMEFAAVPGTAVQITTGGQSAPGVNEMIAAAFQAGPGGSSAYSLLEPFIVDTLLAWMTVFLGNKASKAGWDRLYEFFVASPGAAYTFSAIMTLRSGAWACRPYTAFKLGVRDARPFVVGMHLWLGDRIGATRRHENTGRIYIDRVSKITRKRSRSEWQKWEIVAGDERALRDPFEELYNFTSSLAYGLEQLGAW